MGKVIIGIAEMAVVRAPDSICTIGLGSCVGIAMYDATSRIAGLAHIMLPESRSYDDVRNKAKYADLAVVELLNKMVASGAHKSKITAKIAGGAHMFTSAGGKSDDIMRVGERNIAITKKTLGSVGIPLVASDTGLNYGRTVEIYAADGSYLIKTISKGSKKI